MTRLTTRVAGIVLLFLIIAFTEAVAAEGVKPHQRSPWYIGFGIGGGLDARYTLKGDNYNETITFSEFFNEADKKTPVIAANFKVGGTLSPKTLLGLDITAVGRRGEDTFFGDKIKATLGITNYFLMLTHFPMEEGLFIRVGGGYSNIKLKVKYGGGSWSDTTEGYGFLGGIGYAFWAGKRFNITLNLDHSRQFYNGSNDEPRNSQFTALYVGFDWY